MQQQFHSIKKVFDDFHVDMLSKGRLMVKDTKVGYWGISPTVELFELFQKTQLDKHKNFIDLGSGDGRAVLIADLFTNATGIEFDEELHNLALLHASMVDSKANLIKGNFMKHDLKEYDYVFINPDNKIAGKLEDKLLKEMKPKSKLVVFGPHSHPETMQKADSFDIQGTLISVFTR